MTRCGARVASRRTVQQMGGSFGTAVLAVILSGAVAAHRGRLARAFDIAFWWAAGFSAVAVLLALWLPGAPRAAATAATADGAAEPGQVSGAPAGG